MELVGIDLVTNSRKKRIHAYKQTADKARCLAAGLLLRKFCGITDDSQLTSLENGKPYLKDSDMYFNISHSGNYVVLALSKSEVGVDIEKITPYCDAVALHCFTPPEIEWMRKEGSDEAFYWLWTAKESIMKASGCGFSLPPESFCVVPVDSSPKRVAGKSWSLDWLYYDGHMICRAADGKAGKTELIPLSAGELLPQLSA
jgi:4'-phosphopantetheinyl transferase